MPYINMNQPWVYMCSPSWTPLPHPSPTHPLGSSQCTSPEHPVSCIEPGLAICFTYDNIHVSMLFSWIIPPLPSPPESKRLFYTSVSVLLSRIQGYRYHLSKFHISALIYSIGVFLSDLLHSVYNTYIWNLERWEWWSYMQDGKRATDVKNGLLGSVGEGQQSGMIWEISTETYILPCVKQMTSASSMHEAGCSKLVFWNNPGKEWGGRWEGASGWGDTCAPMADSCRYMAKTTLIL